MLDPRFIRENPETVKKALADRNAKVDIAPLLDAEAEKRELLGKVEDLKRLRNEASKAIGLKKRNKEDATAEMAAVKEVGDQIDGLDGKVRELDEKLAAMLYDIPNVPDESVPVGATEDDNLVVKTVGTPREYGF